MIDPTQTPAPSPSEFEATTVLGGESPAPSELEVLRAELAEAQAMAAEQRSTYLRAAAELDNYRKRAAREAEQARAFAIERFASELLPVLDSLELGLAASGTADSATLAEGMQATLRLLARAFDKGGIVALDPQGQPFDPQQHEAMALQPSADQPADTVLAVVQKGYVLNGRLLRPARVIVARAPDA